MWDKLPSLFQMIRSLQQIPYLASKNIYRVASHMLEMDDEKLQQFCQIILDAKKNLRKCPECFAWIEGGCTFCSSDKRDKKVICVVETWHELVTIERTGGYQGLYHVLGGAISPLDGIGPEELSINELIKRSSFVDEIILATNQTPEGEATASFIASKLPKNLKVTCLARGIPAGSTLEYMDKITIYKAICERRQW